MAAASSDLAHTMADRTLLCSCGKGRARLVNHTAVGHHVGLGKSAVMAGDTGRAVRRDHDVRGIGQGEPCVKNGAAEEFDGRNIDGRKSAGRH